ncbi:MAG: hypothetical protein GDA48_18950 [Hormoscilla sp. GM102CHS1]|nr:hypothetical protein [Hormoscilla sp. GM102CHS1]
MRAWFESTVKPACFPQAKTSGSIRENYRPKPGFLSGPGAIGREAETGFLLPTLV